MTRSMPNVSMTLSKMTGASELMMLMRSRKLSMKKVDLRKSTKRVVKSRAVGEKGSNPSPKRAKTSIGTVRTSDPPEIDE